MFAKYDRDIYTILINVNLCQHCNNSSLRRTIVTIVTWICFLRISEKAVFAQAASERRITLHREHAEDRNIFILLFSPFDSLLTHRLRLQMQLARQPLTQRVGGHIFSQNVYTNKHACIHWLRRSYTKMRNLQK